MFAAIKAQHGGVDVCINNAGLAHPETLLNGKTSGWKNMMDVRGWLKSQVVVPVAETLTFDRK